MIFPNHFTQTQRATATLETMAMNLENAAEAIRATLDGTAQDYHLNTIGEHMTSDSYGLSFTSFGEVRCPSCGVIDWTRGQGDPKEGLCPSCATHRNENKFCRSCETWFPNAEFQNSPLLLPPVRRDGDPRRQRSVPRVPTRAERPASRRARRRRRVFSASL